MKKTISRYAKTKNSNYIADDFFAKFWKESWTYIRTVVDVLREPVLILDKNLKVLAANDAFYSLFQVKPADTEGLVVYELGNGQWDIPALRKLLEDVLSKDTFFRGFEVEHEFPYIGQKTIILNARHIHTKDPVSSKLFPPLIMLAMEDITSMVTMAKTFAEHTNKLEKQLLERAKISEEKIAVLEMIVQRKK